MSARTALVQAQERPPSRHQQANLRRERSPFPVRSCRDLVQIDPYPAGDGAKHAIVHTAIPHFSRRRSGGLASFRPELVFEQKVARGYDSVGVSARRTAIESPGR
ncbi:hypothetical protein SAMN05216266_108138 [Amycolatopsis marina]|uniref:Uncharacterized protein n=1 Tax=Amycolatopsis marina TaxID=490629 RepID=A0A1I1A2V2_9PSEU|nr:hypothetical protein SAMN05216266_108138 [Amycolatopsis marina]